MLPVSHRRTDFLERLSGAGFSTDDIHYVIWTHLDADHVGWNTVWRNGRWEPTFKNAPKDTRAKTYASSNVPDLHEQAEIQHRD